MTNLWKRLTCPWADSPRLHVPKAEHHAVEEALYSVFRLLKVLTCFYNGVCAVRQKNLSVSSVCVSLITVPLLR